MGDGVRKAGITRGLSRLAFGAAAVLLAALGACRGAEQSTQPALNGQHLHVLADWKGTESQRFSAVLRRFETKTGAIVSYQAPSDGVPDELSALGRTGLLPDVAILPQPALLQQYAKAGALLPLDTATVALIDQNYSKVWRGLGSFDGVLYGVWFKAADKSLVWYNATAFERAGVVPPASIDELLAAESTLARYGIPAFAVGGADGWTLTDLFENVFLRSAGADRYDELAQHRLPWTDSTVVDALQTFQRILQPRYVAGGVQAAAVTTFESAVGLLTSSPPRAAMISEGDFVVGALSGPSSRLGVNIGVFPFPAVRPPQPGVVAGGDVAVEFHKGPAADAFMRFLATAEAAALWAAKGGFLSPNSSLDLAVYPDALTRSFARSLLEAGDQLRFDLSDQLPAAFGSNENAGLEPALRALLHGERATTVAQRLEAAASEAFAQDSS